MGLCSSKQLTPEERAAEERSRKIDNENLEQWDK